MAFIDVDIGSGLTGRVDVDTGNMTVIPTPEGQQPPPLIGPGGTPTGPPPGLGGLGPTPGSVNNPPPPPSDGGSALDVLGIKAKLAEIWQSVSDKHAEAQATINTLKANLEGQIRSSAAGAQAEVQRLVGNAKSALDAQIKTLGPSLVALTGAALSGVEGLFSVVAGALASVDDVAGAAGKEISKNKEHLFDFITGALGAGVGGALDLFLGGVEADHTTQLEAILDTFRNVPGVPPELQAALNVKAGKTSPFALLIGMALIIGLAGSLSGATTSRIVEGVSQDFNQNKPNQIIGLGDLAEAAVRGIGDPPQMVTKAARLGFDADSFTMMRDLRTPSPTVTDLVTARFREVINDGQLTQWLRFNGFNDEAQRVIKGAATFFPGPSDLIHFMVRDVFSPAIVEHFGQDANYPQAFTALAQMAGIPENVARWYWTAHWELPSTSQGFEMLQRDVIVKDDLNYLLQAADVMPFWREKLLAISYQPITRVDVRRLHKLGQLDHAQMVTRYRHIGYAPEDAEQLAVFTEKLNSQEKHDEAAALRGRIETRILNAVIVGTLPEDRARTALKALGDADTEINAIIQEARLARAEQLASTIADRIGDLYVNADWKWPEAQTALSARGFTSEEIAARKQLWDLELILHAPNPRTLAERDLTRADITNAMTEGLLTEPEARAALAAMRFDPKEVELIVKLTARKKLEAELKDEIEVAHQRYKAGKIDLAGAQTELDRAQVRGHHREALLAKWDAEKRQVNANLPAATIGELFKKGLIEETEAKSRLALLGYDDREQTLYTALWGSQASVALAKAQTAAARAIKALLPKERDLTTGQLVAAFKVKAITEPTLQNSLAGLGYDAAEITTIITTAKGKPK